MAESHCKDDLVRIFPGPGKGCLSQGRCSRNREEMMPVCGTASIGQLFGCVE